MKKLSRILWSMLALLLVVTSCSDQNENLSPSQDASGKKPSGVYNAGAVTASLDGYTLTIQIDQTGKQQVSHLLLQVEDCDGNLLDANNVVSSTPDADYTTGNGTGCHFAEGSFIKFDDINVQGIVTITITFNVQIQAANLLVKAGQICFGPIPLTFESNCGEDPEGQTETAFAMGDPSQCFIDLDLNTDGRGDFNRWGWTNGPIGEGNYLWPIYAGAGQCDVTKGTHVGNLAISFWGGTATINYNMFMGYTLEESHLYVGSAILPLNVKGKNTVAPGQYPYSESDGTYTINGLPSSIYVVAHGVVSGI